MSDEKHVTFISLVLRRVEGGGVTIGAYFGRDKRPYKLASIYLSDAESIRSAFFLALPDILTEVDEQTETVVFLSRNGLFRSSRQVEERANVLALNKGLRVMVKRVELPPRISCDLLALADDALRRKTTIYEELG